MKSGDNVTSLIGQSELKNIHISLFSGGLSSAFVLENVLKSYGPDNTIALFTDPLWEDCDNYRFISQVIKHFNLTDKFEHRKDGRTPEQIFFKTRLLISKQIAKCSLILKTEQTLKFIKELQQKNEKAKSTIKPILYFGIGINEEHRALNITSRYSPIECRFPLLDKPMTKNEMWWACEQDWGIKVPRMYEMGFSHANCGGRCIKGGHEHFKRLYNVWPERYAEVEDIERRFREQINPQIAILRDRTGGGKRYITLTEFRERYLEGNIKIEGLFPSSNLPCECMF